MESKENLESDKIFKNYFEDDASYYKHISLLFQNLKEKKFQFNDTKKSKKDLIKNMEKNIKNLINYITELKVKENKEEEVYRSLSCIFGSFFGDAIGAYCEFKKPSIQNIKNIFKGNPMFGDDPGQVTDDSEMAIASAFAIMENIKLELNSNYLFYFYGLWHISKPKDEGNTTRKALKPFTKIDITKLNLKINSFNEIFKDIEKDNKKSLANGFLMRTSPIIAYLYFKYKSEITQIFKEENNKKRILFSLFELIKLEVQKDNICTHPNENLCISHSIFCIMSLGAIYGLNSIQILNNVKALLSNEFFNVKRDHDIKDIIMKELDAFDKKVVSSSFDSAFNYFTTGEKNVTNHMGYYVHAFRLTLYYLYFFNEINKEKEYSKFRVIMNQICSFGGDTDTNAAIVGAVIGPLIGYKDFCDGEFLKMISLVPKNRFVFSPALMIIYVYFLKNNINYIELKGKFFIRTLLKLLYEKIDLNDILNNKEGKEENQKNKEELNDQSKEKNNNNQKKDGINDEKDKNKKDQNEKKLEDNNKKKIEDNNKKKIEDNNKKKIEDNNKKKIEDNNKKKTEDNNKKKTEDNNKKKTEDNNKKKTEDNNKKKTEDNNKKKTEDKEKK